MTKRVNDDPSFSQYTTANKKPARIPNYSHVVDIYERELLGDCNSNLLSSRNSATVRPLTATNVCPEPPVPQRPASNHARVVSQLPTQLSSQPAVGQVEKRASPSPMSLDCSPHSNQPKVQVTAPQTLKPLGQGESCFKVKKELLNAIRADLYGALRNIPYKAKEHVIRVNPCPGAVSLTP
ncbi:hypothetical protein HDE_02336 [Halotydeus destructor]|nr:hypothetical protein HDE_02336 [Halotydeus destructor]